MPYWSENPTPAQWLAELRRTFENDPNTGWSMYIHIPFCEALCTFCGCNTFITRNHDNEISYTAALHAEWETYLREVPALKTAPIRQIHLSGGTPTFFSGENLKKLLRPDRIALYSFAFVPWIKKAHRLFTEDDLPKGADKRVLYEIARELFLDAGYVELGLDHFALPDDNLYQAYESGDLHRNFMGYTDMRTDVLLGLGVSSISEAPTCFHQNSKHINEYKAGALAGEIPTLRGHLLNEEDMRHREQILQFMCQGHVTLRDDEQVADARHYLAELLRDGLVTMEGQEMALTERGRPFMRNAAMALDMRLRRNKPDTRVFSQSV